LETDFSRTAMRAFFERLSVPAQGDVPWLEFHALKLGERIVATYAGAAHRGHFTCLVNSFDNDPKIAKSSPGDILLMRLVADQCDRGRKWFDLGIGEAHYKASYCDVTIPLCDIVIGIGLTGRVCGICASLLLRAKRMIKQRPPVFAATRWLLRNLRGLTVR
jgi:CelD/BcsL family acetyltransferase involved in cellulose biosynthesis